jgi:hypothetical protein
MALTELPAVERRRRDRSQGILLRRRHGQIVHTHIERRCQWSGFNVAAALELHLDEFPSREAMLVLLQSWRYAADAGAANAFDDDYDTTISRAIDVMRTAPDVATAIVVLQRRVPTH